MSFTKRTSSATASSCSKKLGVRRHSMLQDTSRAYAATIAATLIWVIGDLHSRPLRWRVHAGGAEQARADLACGHHPRHRRQRHPLRALEGFRPWPPPPHRLPPRLSIQAGSARGFGAGLQRNSVCRTYSLPAAME
jgi:hypothetical protein